MRNLFTDPLARFMIRFGLGWLFIGTTILSVVNLIS